MGMMEAKIFSVLIGYVFGNFLTAEIVAHRIAGKSAADIGDTGNPGMANIMENLGFVPGILTLTGDLGKVIAAGLLSYVIFKGSGWIVTLYAGLGCTLGHNYPVWRKFKGGKGVATISMSVVLYAFFAGLAANIAGMIVVFVTQYLCIGGPVIPFAFTVIMFLCGDTEAAVIGIALTCLSLLAHGGAILMIKKGGTKKTDVLGILRKKL